MRFISIIASCLLSLSAFAVIETYEFESDTLRQRYQHFTQELRCPKCQNQNLSGSNSPIAQDLRRELHRLLHEGYSDQDISDFMVARYGEFVLYRPPLNQQTLVLWLAPAFLLLLSALVVLVLMRKQNRMLREDVAAQQLDVSEQKALDDILKERNND